MKIMRFVRTNTWSFYVLLLIALEEFQCVVFFLSHGTLHAFGKVCGLLVSVSNIRMKNNNNKRIIFICYSRNISSEAA